ncbi:hypothetical protein B9N43_04810 [Denitratisoma sp. DHT3]|uniref:DUF3330 domain-containing protein n=1 Tax=Denitratisoma sp. DHT3 TaxID=1981880 RepID=UPI001198777E|nr:DUF3330 domain-containing protein [Denitratisoma sp. DHT3]QDX80624.1 hypothetical protein B9N43_04810 [Denitratisoma sp. DHT3]
MGVENKPPELQKVTCEECRKEIPNSAAMVSEVVDYVAYFCGLDCYQEWRQRRPDEAAAAPTPRTKK